MGQNCASPWRLESIEPTRGFTPKLIKTRSAQVSPFSLSQSLLVLKQVSTVIYTSAKTLRVLYEHSQKIRKICAEAKKQQPEGEPCLRITYDEKRIQMRPIDCRKIVHDKSFDLSCEKPSKSPELFSQVLWDAANAVVEKRVSSTVVLIVCRSQIFFVPFAAASLLEWTNVHVDCASDIFGVLSHTLMLISLNENFEKMREDVLSLARLWNHYYDDVEQSLEQDDECFQMEIDLSAPSNDSPNWGAVMYWKEEPIAFLLATVTSNGSSLDAVPNFNSDLDVLFYIDYFYVKHEYQNQKIGGRMCQVVLDSARSSFSGRRICVLLAPKDDDASRFWVKTFEMEDCVPFKRRWFYPRPD